MTSCLATSTNKAINSNNLMKHLLASNSSIHSSVTWTQIKQCVDNVWNFCCAWHRSALSWQFSSLFSHEFCVINLLCLFTYYDKCTMLWSMSTLVGVHSCQHTQRSKTHFFFLRRSNSDGVPIAHSPRLSVVGVKSKSITGPSGQHSTQCAPLDKYYQTDTCASTS